MKNNKWKNNVFTGINKTYYCNYCGAILNEYDYYEIEIDLVNVKICECCLDYVFKKSKTI